jgi:hypothetical protein
METDYLACALRLFEYYKLLGEKSMDQMPEEKLFWQYNEESNSVATIVKHLSGNMLSRWTDFLTTDGEKDWRNRDSEFVNDLQTREALLARWNQGWHCLLDSLKQLNADDLQKTVYIRNEAHTVLEAINRQLAHYPYHVGQIVYIAKMVADHRWKTLSIPRGHSDDFNTQMFSKPKKGN